MALAGLGIQVEYIVVQADTVVERTAVAVTVGAVDYTAVENIAVVVRKVDIVPTERMKWTGYIGCWTASFHSVYDLSVHGPADVLNLPSDLYQREGVPLFDFQGDLFLVFGLAADSLHWLLWKLVRRPMAFECWDLAHIGFGCLD